jgi:hypothetical protein
MKLRNIAISMALTCGAILPLAQASEWNQRTVITFNQPVEMPGQVLPAGTYVFKLADSPSNRHIVQVFNQNEDHIYGTFLAIPDFRLKPSSKTVITIEERASDAPMAVKEWFYPGRNYGHEFVYPKQEMRASTVNPSKPVVKELAVVQEPTLAPATIDAEPVQPPSQVATPEPKGSEFAIETVEFQAQELPQELPHTASDLPLIGLLGIASLGLAGLLRLATVRER